MQKEGFVSLWVGNIQSSETLGKLLEVSYTEDGDSIPSIFARGFDIERYDEAVREVDLYDELDDSLSGLLEGFSYDDVIVPKFTAICGGRLPRGYNTVILLYDFQYVGDKKAASFESAFLEFLGTVEYRGQRTTC